MAKLPCSQACYCRLLPQQALLPIILAAKSEHPPSTQTSEKKFRDSSFEMMFTIISSSSSSSFGSGKSDSLDHSATVNGSPTPSYRSKVFNPPGLTPDWKRPTDSNISTSSPVPPSPAPSYFSSLQVVNTPPAAHLRRDARRDSWDGLQPVSHAIRNNTSPRQRSPSFV